MRVSSSGPAPENVHLTRCLRTSHAARAAAEPPLVAARGAREGLWLELSHVETKTPLAGAFCLRQNAQRAALRAAAAGQATSGKRFVCRAARLLSTTKPGDPRQASYARDRKNQKGRIKAQAYFT